MDLNNIDELIDLFDSFGTKDSEFNEEEGDTSSASSSTSGYPTVTKWESGVVRGPANQIAVVKWADIVKINRGKANTLL